MKRFIFTTLFMLPFLVANAQDNKLKNSWEIEIDPIAYILKGYSLHGIYQVNHFRYDLGVFGIQQPESYHGNKGYSLMSRGFGAKASYLIKGIPGFYTGLSTGMAFHESQNTTSLEKTHGRSASIGIILGYRLFFKNSKSPDLKGLYITPWASFDYNYHFNKMAFGGYNFRMKTFSIFPTIHIGYRF